MRLYLSSYKFGEKSALIPSLMPSQNKKIGYVPNALDYTGADQKRKEESAISEMKQLRELGLEPELLDLHNYFGREEALENKLQQLGGVWVRGGNTFVLRQAMKLSGFDHALHKLKTSDFLYAGYSAGICVLAPDLNGLQTVDDPNNLPYAETKQVTWQGLGLLKYLILPHYKSEHPESPAIDQEVIYCETHHIPFKTLRDGEVIIFDPLP